MSSATTFYILGGCLVAAAVLISFLGLRATSFPASRALLVGGVAAFAALVVASAAFALVNAREEQDHRRAELAHEEEQAAAEEEAATEEGPPPEEAETPEQPGAPAGEATTLDVTSPEDGGFSFEPAGLEAPAGEITLAYDNPSLVPHNIAVEFEAEELGVSETITEGPAELTLTLEPGQYIFYCEVPGHRDQGMEGDLTVSSP